MGKDMILIVYIPLISYPLLSVFIIYIIVYIISLSYTMIYIMRGVV